ncbi:DUF3108 domain-containing protein [Chelativorans sp.]|uniref:DUF3108 domain-containing protein n=1 Tax=Chelativorans sp. TaxID=2203393 RepID=UPI002811FF3F|nr:DUF3108 domain-containing protein [Chelativorans sp.]
MTTFPRRVLLAAILALSSAHAAAAETYRARYDASLLGLPVGRAFFETRFDGQAFAIAASFASAGIARIFERTDGTVEVSGTMGEEMSRPELYALEYSEGKKRQATTIRFRDGTVTETRNEPPPKKRGEDWVPLAPEHLTGVADPISALLLPVSTDAEVCNRTVRIYDGEIRADIVLQPAPEESFRSAAVTCRARFVPVSGYRKTRSSIIFLRDRARIFVGFAPVAGRNLYSPVEATIATKVGTVHIRARPM